MKQRLVQRRAAPVVLCILLVICLLYQAYRYPFQINSALTSPTYSSTPAWLQSGKWGLVAAAGVLLAIAVLWQARASMSSGSRLRTVALALEVGLIVLTVIRVLLGAASVEPWIFLICATTGLLITLSVGVDDTASRLICRVIVIYSVLCVVAQAVQVALFLWVGRLPALAYAGSPSVRFGSVLDDPNGFAVLLAALIPTTWISLAPRPYLRMCVGVALVCCLPLTQSWTGVTAAVVALTTTYLLSRGLARDLRKASAIAISAVIVVGVAAFFARSTIAELVRLKRGSVEDHADAFAQIAPRPSAVAAAPEAHAHASASTSASTTSSASATAAPMHLAPSGQVPGHQISHSTWTSGIESSYINIYVNYGPLLLIVYVGLGLIAIVLLLRGWTRLSLALRVGSASYLLCFLLASANLGLDRTFPCNILYFLFCGLAFASTTRRHGGRVLRRTRNTEHGGTVECLTRTSSSGGDIQF